MTNMQLYKMVQDEQALVKFIDWLPDLENGETYYVTLFARKKYCTSSDNVMKTDSQLKRFTSDKRYLLDKIYQLEIPVGRYKGDSVVISQEALALYITPNPRSLEKAAKQSLKSFADLITQEYNGYNPHHCVMTEIQKASGRKIFMDFDFDGIKFHNVEEDIISYANLEAINVVKTRGGFHLLVEMSKIQQLYSKIWYQKLSSMCGVDVRGTDNLLPVPGCCQGGFVPELIVRNH
jgi:hypothetical protein